MFWKRKRAGATPLGTTHIKAKAEVSKPKVEKPATQDVTIYAEEGIQQKVEALSEPGSTVFFYLAGSPREGGPLGRGAAVIELNPNYPGKKQKKYILYIADVAGMQPIGKGTKVFDSDKPKEIASWIKERHYKPVPRY